MIIANSLFDVLSLFSYGVSSSSSSSSNIQTRATPSIPRGWQAVAGCVSDSGSSRLLGSYTTSKQQTPEACMNTCAQASQKYAGVQYGSECWCGSTLNTAGGAGRSIASSSCNMACSGDSSQKCGGGYAINLYTNPSIVSSSATAPAGWSLVSNCLTDGPSRLLSVRYTSNSNTPASCVATCGANGYKYSGTEYSSECWCGNSLNTASGLGKASSACTMSCSGGGSTPCGGQYAVGPVFQKLPSSSSSTRVSTFSTSKSSSISSSSSKISSSTSSSSTKASSTSSSTKVSSTTSSSSSTQVSSTSSSRASTTVTTSSSPISSKPSSTVSSTVSSKSSSSSTTSSSSTSSSTVSSSSSLSVRASTSSSTSSSSSSSSLSSTTSSRSSTTSSASSSTTSKASSSSSSSVSKTSSSSSYVPTPSQMPLAELVPGWTLEAPCVYDKNPPNSVLTTTSYPVNMTVNVCINTCNAQGYAYAGVEAGDTCHCGNTLNYAGGSGGALSVSTCNIACKGRADVYCGGYNALSIYYKVPPATKRYQVIEEHIGDSFFLNYDFFTEKDPTSTNTQYISRTLATKNDMLWFQSDGAAVANVDNKTYLPVGIFRNSTRFKSKSSFDNGLFMFDIQRMPHGCGVWPSLWTTGPNWPAEGEIDIIEGVNTVIRNQMTLHTNNTQCTTNNVSSADTTSSFGRRTCFSSQSAGTGCNFVDASPDSFGAGFNQNGGGVYALLMDTTGIKIWRFNRLNVPSDITAKNPNPGAWGLPRATFPSTPACNTTKEVRQQQIVWNTAFCGGWAGPEYIADGCGSLKGNYSVAIQSCINDVANPQNYPTAAWVINSVRIYQ